MDTKIIWYFNRDKKERGTIFVKKDEYRLALEFEDNDLVNQDLKLQIKKFLKRTYRVDVHQLTYWQNPLSDLCKKFRGRDRLCEELGITEEQLCDLNLSFNNPHIKSQLLIGYLLPVLTDQQFANWFYSTVYNLYNDIREPLLIYPNSLSPSFYQWLYHESPYSHLNQLMLGKKIPSAMMVGDYIYEHRGDYAKVYNEYLNSLSEYIYHKYDHIPNYILSLKHKLTLKLKRNNVLISDRLNHLGMSYKAYNGMFAQVSPIMTKYIELIAKDTGFNKYDILFTILMDSVDYYAKKPSYKRRVTAKFLKEQDVKLYK
jgi:hypothetical protein